MATSWMDGFDDYPTADLAKYYSVGAASPRIDIVSGGRVGNRLRLQYYVGTEWLTRAIGSPVTEIVVAFAFYHTGGAGGNIMWVGDASGGAIDVAVLNDGSLRVYRGHNTPSYRGFMPNLGMATILGTSASGVVPGSTWVPLEIRIVLSDTAGVVEIRRSGTVVLNLTSIDTLATGATITLVGLTGANAQYFYYDDFCIGDTFHGDTRVDSHLPVADVQNDWTPSAGSDRYAMVDDAAPDGDSTTITSAVVGDKSTFQVETLKNAGSDPIARQLCWIGKKADAGASSVGAVLTHGGSDTDSTGQPLTTDYVGYAQALAGCTEADFNADRYGLQKTA